MILDTTSILSGIATAMFVAGRATCGQVHAAYPKVYTTRAQRPLGKAFVCSQRICEAVSVIDKADEFSPDIIYKYH